jgi:ubiquinone/menaquinone biosynthesis C-methylase UbiE
MSVIQEQIAYYRARAGEYDEWFYRLGRYDMGETDNQRWFDDAEMLMQKLHALGPLNTALELASGTGIWTRELLKIARHITALDAAPEVLAINREKLGNPAHVTYEQVDLFAWQPAQEYDLVSFTFWLSHVPPDALDDFLAKIQRATRRGGKIFMVDSRRIQTGTAKDTPIEERDDHFQVRKLNDGTTYQIVKIFYEEDFLREKLAQYGFTGEVGMTDYFIYAIATRE